MRAGRDVLASLGHIAALALMAFPGCFYYNSTNVLSNALVEYYGSQDIVSMSYTLYSIPSIFACFLFSVLIDLVGPGIVLPCLQAAVALSSVVCALAESRELFLVGKFLYGLAGESVLCAQSKLISIYVTEQLRPWAFGVSMSCYMLGEAVASWVLPEIPTIHDCMWVCFALLVLECGLGWFYSYLEWRRVRAERGAGGRGAHGARGTRRAYGKDEGPGESEGSEKSAKSEGGSLSRNRAGSSGPGGQQSARPGSSDSTSGETEALLLRQEESRSGDGRCGACCLKAAGRGRSSAHGRGDASARSRLASGARRAQPCRGLKEAFLQTWRNARRIPPIFWLCLFGRMFYVASKATYDSLSVLTLQSILGIGGDMAVLFTSMQQLSSAAAFLLSFISNISPKAPIAFLLAGISLLAVCHVTFISFGFLGASLGPVAAEGVACAVSVAIGLSFGMFASNASYVIVSLAGRELAASGMGLTYSVQYLIMSGLNPLVNHIGATAGYVYACFCYLGFLALSLGFLVPAAVRICRGGEAGGASSQDSSPLEAGSGDEDS